MKLEMEHNTIKEETEKEMSPPSRKQQDRDGADRNAATGADDDKECSSILSVLSNEEVSITSEILDQKSFIPRKDSDGEDLNGHICHIDSPETDTYQSTSDVIHGESLMDDISSMLGEVYGYGLDSVDNTYTDDTTLFPSDIGKEEEWITSYSGAFRFILNL